MMILLPHILSWLVGFLIFHKFVPPDQKVPCSIRFFLSAGIGLGFSSYTTFLSYVFFDRLTVPFVVGCHAVFLIGLIALLFPRLKATLNKATSAGITAPFSGKFFMELFLWGTVSFQILRFAALFPDGGWDAWSVWNFKSRFLFLGQEHWRAMFDPVLWRSSPHYPLFLPLLNVWGWIFTGGPTHLVPFWNAVVLSMLTLGLLLSVLTLSVGRSLAWIGIFTLVTNSTLLFYTTSQYSDVLLGFFLLMIMTTFGLSLSRPPKPNALYALGGLFIGFLTFIKPEGAVMALILLPLAAFEIGTKRKGTNSLMASLGNLIGGFATGFLPTFLFVKYYAPSNITFINGLTSAQSPAEFERLKTILRYMLLEFCSEKWHGLWAVLFTGALAGLWASRTFPRNTSGSTEAAAIKVPKILLWGFLSFYVPATLAYYWVNTYFEINWWLTVTFPRILFVLLPAVAWGCLNAAGYGLKRVKN